MTPRMHAEASYTTLDFPPNRRFPGVDPRGLPTPLTSTMRGTERRFRGVLHRSKNCLRKPESAIVAPRTFAIVHVSCRQIVVSCARKCRVSGTLVQGFADLFSSSHVADALQYACGNVLLGEHGWILQILQEISENTLHSRHFLNDLHRDAPGSVVWHTFEVFVREDTCKSKRVRRDSPKSLHSCGGGLPDGMRRSSLVVGCAGVRSEAPQKEEQAHTEATASEEARCEGTRTLTRNFGAGLLTTNDVPGCPKGGLLFGTDKRRRWTVGWR